jgi:hypothetical protein
VTRRFFWSGRTTQRQLVGGWRRWAKQWSLWSRAARRRRSNSAREKRNEWWPPLVTSRRRDKEASPCGAATTGDHRHRAALRVVSVITRNRAACGPGDCPGPSKAKSAADTWARPSNKIPPNSQTPFKFSN